MTFPVPNSYAGVKRCRRAECQEASECHASKSIAQEKTMRVLQNEPFDYADDFELTIRDLIRTVRKLDGAQALSIGIEDENGKRFRSAKLVERKLSDGSLTYDIVLSLEQ
jgi:uncharacterized protein (DUF1499 family)